MNKLTSELLLKFFPFSGLSLRECDDITNTVSIDIQKFEKNDVIFGKDSREKKIGFVLEGECEVDKITPKNSAVPLNYLKENDSFGILSLFQPSSEYPTKIIAKTRTTVLFINGDDMLLLIERYSKIASNVIAFLSERIAFLNKKIATFSAGTVEGKLASYLLLKHGSGAMEIDVNMSQISKELNIGRASLYRVLEAFQNDGYIRCETKKIIFINPDGLERII